MDSAYVLDSYALIAHLRTMPEAKGEKDPQGCSRGKDKALSLCNQLGENILQYCEERGVEKLMRQCL